MNWMGGARSRIEKKNDKKVQKLFFERKRQEKKFGVMSKPNSSPKKNAFSISQDLLSFHTVMRAHDKNAKHRGTRQAKLKHVEIDDMTPARIQHNISSLSTSPIGKSSIDFQRVADEKPSKDFHRQYSDSCSSKNQQFRIGNSSFPPFSSQRSKSREASSNQRDELHNRELKKRALHKSPVAASTPMYPVYSSNNFKNDIYETSTQSKKPYYEQGNIVPSHDMLSRKEPDDKPCEYVRSPKSSSKQSYTKRASYFNLFKDSQKACSTNVRYEAITSSHSNRKPSPSFFIPNAPIQIDNEVESNRENGFNQEPETRRSPLEMIDTMKTPYRLVVSPPGKFIQKSPNRVTLAASDQLATYIPKSPVISPCLLPDRFSHLPAEVKTSVPDFSHFSNSSEVSYEKVRINLDEDEEDFNPYNKPGPHSTINLNLRLNYSKENETRENAPMERSHCDKEPLSLASCRDLENSFQDQVVYQQWISPKAAQKHIDNLLDDLDRDSFNGAGFSSSSSLSNSSLSTSGRTSSYNEGSNSDLRASNGNLSSTGHDVSSFSKKDASVLPSVVETKEDNSKDLTENREDEDNKCKRDPQHKDVRNPADESKDTIRTNNEATSTELGNQKEIDDSKKEAVVCTEDLENPESSVNVTSTPRNNTENDQSVNQDDKDGNLKESSLEYHLNRTLFDLKQRDMFLYEQHLMLKAYLLSACE